MHALSAPRAALYALLCISLCSAPGGGAHGGEQALAARLSGRRVAAHRGGYRFADSNTIARFEAARRTGADIIETDLRLSRDGVVFLFHDRDLRGATDCSGPFSAHTAAEIDRCLLHGLDRGPDRFERALQWAHGRVVLDAELKAPEVVRPAIDLVRRYHAYEWVYFQVRNGLDLYRAVRAYDRRVALEAAPAGERRQAYLAALLAQHDPRLLIIQLHPESLTPQTFALLHASGKLASLDAWHVGSERTWSLWPFARTAACEAVWRHGVDIAVTNDPGDCVRQRSLTAH